MNSVHDGLRQSVSQERSVKPWSPHNIYIPVMIRSHVRYCLMVAVEHKERYVFEWTVVIDTAYRLRYLHAVGFDIHV